MSIFSQQAVESAKAKLDAEQRVYIDNRTAYNDVLKLRKFKLHNSQRNAGETYMIADFEVVTASAESGLTTGDVICFYKNPSRPGKQQQFVVAECLRAFCELTGQPLSALPDDPDDYIAEALADEGAELAGTLFRLQSEPSKKDGYFTQHFTKLED